jgi:S-disulfanyl-L-cysteine oxidoreductase SoxD
MTGILLLSASAQTAAPTRTTVDGVYSADQAKRGAALYQKLCSSCHGEELEGRGPAPTLSGDAFVGQWSGQPLSNLFEKIQTTMPADRPGSLTRPDNADILAYLLSANDFKAGASELPSDQNSLSQIQTKQAPPKK